MKYWSQLGRSTELDILEFNASEYGRSPSGVNGQPAPQYQVGPADVGMANRHTFHDVDARRLRIGLFLLLLLRR
jgi:hypothetical protein